MHAWMHMYVCVRVCVMIQVREQKEHALVQRMLYTYL